MENKLTHLIFEKKVKLNKTFRIRNLYFFDRKKSIYVLKYRIIGPSPSGKASGFGLDIPRFES